MHPAGIAGILLLLCLALPASAARADASHYCDVAAEQASRAVGVPRDVLLALTRVETGRMRGGRLQPWPWTVNMEGKGYWFDSRAEALAFVNQSYASGARSFDVGCFQINQKWHGKAFRSFEQMFDPLDNATYAARFMNDLFAERNSWSWAAGAFHSRTESLAAKYRTRFDRIRVALGTKPAPEHVPVILASADVGQAPPTGFPATRVSTWRMFLAKDAPDQPAVNGSLAFGLAANAGQPLLQHAAGALF